jgi:anti-anti-sigma factor
MTGIMMQTKTRLAAATEITELVKGCDRLLLERMMPLVRAQSVVLDLRKVTRIDAAGLAALIKLYCASRDMGHKFAIANPTQHVSELLALVRLDGLLVSRNAGEFAYAGHQFQESAA